MQIQLAVSRVRKYEKVEERMEWMETGCDVTER